jgi:hypothetical protein
MALVVSRVVAALLMPVSPSPSSAVVATAPISALVELGAGEWVLETVVLLEVLVTKGNTRVVNVDRKPPLAE